MDNDNKRRSRGRPQLPLDWRHKLAAFRIVWYGSSRETRACIANGIGVSRQVMHSWLKRKDFRKLLAKEFRYW